MGADNLNPNCSTVEIEKRQISIICAPGALGLVLCYIYLTTTGSMPLLLEQFSRGYNSPSTQYVGTINEASQMPWLFNSNLLLIISKWWRLLLAVCLLCFFSRFKSLHYFDSQLFQNTTDDICITERMCVVLHIFYYYWKRVITMIFNNNHEFQSDRESRQCS